MAALVFFGNICDDSTVTKMGDIMKACRTCLFEKPESEFCKNKRAHDGLTIHCRECNRKIQRERHARWKAKNPERAREVIKKACDKYRSKPEVRAAISEQKKVKRREKRALWEKLKDPEFRKNNKDEFQEMLYERHLSKETSARWRKLNIQKRREVVKQWETRNKHVRRQYYHSIKERDALKLKARRAVAYAVKMGKLKKPSECECCGSEKRLEGHHIDYNQPLEVEWLCRKCHMLLHKLYNELFTTDS